jgi:hypothetical protein
VLLFELHSADPETIEMAAAVPIEPRDAERIMRKLEEPYQLVVKRPARLSHSTLV